MQNLKKNIEKKKIGFLYNAALGLPVANATDKFDI